MKVGRPADDCGSVEEVPLFVERHRLASKIAVDEIVTQCLGIPAIANAAVMRIAAPMPQQVLGIALQHMLGEHDARRSNRRAQVTHPVDEIWTGDLVAHELGRKATRAEQIVHHVDDPDPVLFKVGLDTLEQLFVDAALKAGSTADIRLAVERVAGLRAIPPERFVGWREAANRAAL